MNKQAFNPYLPSWEYIPDGEPYVFDGRVYVYGSHDRFNGHAYCLNDYVTWSAPVDDLSDWRYEGVIYEKTLTAGLTSIMCWITRAWFPWPCVIPLPGNSNFTAMSTIRTARFWVRRRAMSPSSTPVS